MTELSIVIPTYNEAGNLPVLIDAIEKLGLDCEIIVADDKSPDGTGEVANRLNDVYGNIRLLSRSAKMGIATAVRDATLASDGRFVAVMDCDMQHPPELLPAMLEEARRGTAMVIASRYTEGGAPNMSAVRRAISRFATGLAHFMIPQTRNIRDPLSGYFLFRRDAVDIRSVTSGSYKVLLEILATANLSVSEIPFSFGTRYSGRSKLGFTELLRYIGLVLRLSDYRVAKFIAVGLAGMAVNEGLLFLLEPHAPLLLASAAAVEASIISNFIMNNSWTFRKKVSGAILNRLAKYNAVMIAGALLNIGVLGILVFLHFEYLAANFVGIIFAFGANYLGSESVVWRFELPLG